MVPFGLGGGGLLGGVSLEDFCLVGILTESASTLSFLIILLRTCATGVKLLILLGSGGLGFGVLVSAGPALSASRWAGRGAPIASPG